MKINEKLYPNLFPQVSEISARIAKEIRARDGYVNVNDPCYEASEQDRVVVLILLLMQDKNDAVLPEILHESRTAIKSMLYHLLSKEGHKYISDRYENLKGSEKRFYGSLLNVRNDVINCCYAESYIDEALQLSSDELNEINHPEPEYDKCLVD